MIATSPLGGSLFITFIVIFKNTRLVPKEFIYVTSTGCICDNIFQAQLFSLYAVLFFRRPV